MLEGRRAVVRIRGAAVNELESGVGRLRRGRVASHFSHGGYMRKGISEG